MNATKATPTREGAQRSLRVEELVQAAGRVGREAAAALFDGGDRLQLDGDSVRRLCLGRARVLRNRPTGSPTSLPTSLPTSFMA
ncbi:hypothetical protein [Streptomyces atroolivaceus]|uniref:hypothetical protein n=1 Tax=Streptomyces atroolivaceus TaxID=66869 RepID=UPI00378E5ABA